MGYCYAELKNHASHKKMFTNGRFQISKHSGVYVKMIKEFEQELDVKIIIST